MMDKFNKNNYEILSDQIISKVIKIDNKVIKYGSYVFPQEAETIIFIKNNTSIPVPKIDKFYTENNITFIEMEYIEGDTLEKIWDTLDEDKKYKIVNQLNDYIKQLRNIEGNYIGGINKSCCFDSIFCSEGNGPFDNEREFNNWIVNAISNRYKGYYHLIIDGMLRSKENHKILFTHGDLVPRNIIIKDFNIVGIIDWQMSGYYPEYWEYVKILNYSRWMCDWVFYIDKIIKSYYTEFSYISDIRRILK